MDIKGKSFSVFAALAAALALILTVGAVPARAQDAPQTGQKDKRPNILLIVADDMGYADLGSYGGEINTPVLDDLAKKGSRYTNFYVAPTCSPTRSMLLSGTDNHVAGMGMMAEYLHPNQVGQPGYEGALNKRVVSIATLLRDGGYHTYMAGKWHLGTKPDQNPHARGFERVFTLGSGAASHFNDGWNIMWQIPNAPYTENGVPVEKLPKDFYSSKNYVDKTIQYIEEGRGDGKPFFSYLAFTAPHGPLHVPDEWLRRYKNKYDEGWDVIRHRRLARMQELGIVDKGVNAADRLFFLPRASMLAPAARVMTGRKMEIYASMVEYLDDQVGRVFDYLKEIGEYDNTVVIFMSDNVAEGNDLMAMVAGQAGTMGFLHAANNFPQMGHNYLGRKGTYAEVGPAWAQVSSTPFRFYKGMVTEGGVRSPLIVSGPGVKGSGELNKKAVLHVMDVAPTLLELAGIEQPGPTYKGREVATMQGRSWVDMLSGTTQSPRGESDWLGWEMFGNRAILKGDWKITRMYKPYGTLDWQLFNLAEDLGEQYDLSDRFPEKRNELIALWDEYVETNGVIVVDRSILEGHRRAFPDQVQEYDSYPPVRGMEHIPHNELLELMSK